MDENRAVLAEGVTINVPTELLRTLVTVYELRSFTKAAQLLQLTQPAVSQQIKKLEIIIGRDIIDRNLSGINLTETGEEVLKSAQRLLSINDQIVLECGTEFGTQMMRLGVPNLLAGILLPQIVQEIHRHMPDAQLQTCCENSPNLLRMLRLGYLDIAFAFCTGEEAANAACSWTEAIGWVGARSLEPPAVDPVPLISSPSVLQVDRIATEALKRAKRRYRIVFSAVDFAARFAAVAAGLGYMPLTKRLCPPHLVLEERVLPSLGSFSVGIFVREEFEPKGLEAMIGALQAVSNPGPR
jgi:DNA-binding transcriptional LysR family regulator